MIMDFRTTKSSTSHSSESHHPMGSSGIDHGPTGLRLTLCCWIQCVDVDNSHASEKRGIPSVIACYSHKTMRQWPFNDRMIVKSHGFLEVKLSGQAPSQDLSGSPSLSTRWIWWTQFSDHLSDHFRQELTDDAELLSWVAYTSGGARQGSHVEPASLPILRTPTQLKSSRTCGLNHTSSWCWIPSCSSVLMVNEPEIVVIVLQWWKSSLFHSETMTFWFLMVNPLLFETPPFLMVTSPSHVTRVAS